MIAIAAAGGVGAALRFLVDAALPGRGQIPWSTLLINLTGSALIGLIIGTGILSPAATDVLTIGLLGGYTTFSTAAVQAAEMLLRGRRTTALGYALGMLIASVILAALGLWAGQIGVDWLMR